MRARMAQYDLDELLVQVRRIEEHREKGAEKKIRNAYREILEELRHYLADVYSRYAEDDRLNYEILQKHSYYARFLEEVEQKINDLSPEAKRLIRSTVEQAYEYTYNGMIDCVKRSNIVPDIAEGLKGCTDWILKRAVENPISKLTLNDRLEKHRKEIIYDIKQDISVGLLNGDRYSTMAKRVKNSVEGDYKKAIRITRTETHRVREAGNLDAATSVQEAVDRGNVPVKMMKVWKTMRDERVRPSKQKGKNWKYDHRKMEGVSVPIDEEFKLPSGAKTMAPGQSGVAGEDINCRCYLSYKVEEKNNIEKHSHTDIMESDLGKFKNKLRSDKAITKEYYSCLKDKFAHGSDDAKSLFVKYVREDSVADTSFEGVSQFHRKKGKIFMHYGADMRNPRGSGVTWFHEHGHMIDKIAGDLLNNKKAGNLSDDDEIKDLSNDDMFRALLKEDALQYRLLYGKTHQLNTLDEIDEAIGPELNQMRKHSAVSDILEGLTKVKGCSGHPNGYWDNPIMISSEAFAHMFEAQFDTIRYNEMKKYFPESLAYFEKKIKEAL